MFPVIKPRYVLFDHGFEGSETQPLRQSLTSYPKGERLNELQGASSNCNAKEGEGVHQAPIHDHITIDATKTLCGMGGGREGVDGG